MIVYKVKCRHLTDEEGMEYDSYGLAAMREEYEVMTVDEITVRKAEIEALACMCNRGSLALEHLMDVVEDWLSS
ncbi:MAG: hypothetical protein IJ315_03240 [Firmicutes bacterium]|nr:hypothetical protein [Bacillota bacterium]